MSVIRRVFFLFFFSRFAGSAVSAEPLVSDESLATAAAVPWRL